MATQFRENKTTIEHKKEILIFCGGLGGYARIVSELPPKIDREGNKILVFVLAVNEILKQKYHHVILNNSCDVNGKLVIYQLEQEVVYVKMEYPEIFCPQKSFNFNFDTVFRICFTGFNHEDDINTWYAKSLAMENKTLVQRLDILSNLVNVLLEDNSQFIELRTEVAKRENKLNKTLKMKSFNEQEAIENKKLEGEDVNE